MSADATTRRVPAHGLHLQIVEAGPPDGPPVILLHGFPDFWWSWRHQVGPLAQHGFRVIAPDLRGYGLSDRPRGVTAYGLDALVADTLALAESCGHRDFSLVGHDWGGIIAWETAVRHPTRVRRLAILNAPHLDVWSRAIASRPGQTLRSWYTAFFQLPVLPEALLSGGNFLALRTALARIARPGSFTPDDLRRYVQAWSQPGALTAMVNYYRALRRWRPRNPPSRVTVPTLLIWGVRDPFLERRVGEENLALCDRGEGLFLPEASHWASLDEPDAVNAALIRFLDAEGWPK